MEDEKPDEKTIAIDYAKNITSTYLDDNILLTKEQLNSYLYWAVINGMHKQKKIDIDKLLF